MPWTYSIDKAREFMWVRASGVVTEAEVAIGAAKAVGDPDFGAHYRLLIDYSEATSISMSVDAVARFAQSKAFAPRSRRAFLATTPLAFGLGRMYEIYASLGDTSAPVRVFHDRAEALAWLNSDVPPEQVIE
jgi:hypothetical protein